MRRLLECVGGVLAIGGLSGLVHELTGWFALFGFLGALNPFEDYPTYWNVSLIVAGVALLAAAEARKG